MINYFKKQLFVDWEHNSVAGIFALLYVELWFKLQTPYLSTLKNELYSLG